MSSNPHQTVKDRTRPSELKSSHSTPRKAKIHLRTHTHTFLISDSFGFFPSFSPCFLYISSHPLVLHWFLPPFVLLFPFVFHFSLPAAVVRSSFLLSIITSSVVCWFPFKSSFPSFPHFLYFVCFSDYLLCFLPFPLPPFLSSCPTFS